jgi:aldose sugar dehydrogenase
MFTRFAWVVLSVGWIAPLTGFAQQAIGIHPVALAQDAYIFDTAEQHRIRVVVLTRGLTQPWALQLLPSGDALVAERSHGLRLIHDVTAAAGRGATLDPQPIEGLPVVEPHYDGAGVLDVVLHPDFKQNGLLYMTFNTFGAAPKDAKAQFPEWKSRLALIRARLAGRTLVDVKQLFVGSLGCTCAARALIGKDGLIYLSSGELYADEAQHLDTTAGKILRLTAEGGIPADNPFVRRAGARPEIFSFGHRDSFGLIEHPATGALLNVEHGPNGGDELNRILPGRNYGWPTVTFGRNYDGTRKADSPVGAGFEPPLIVWLPSIAPTSLMVYTGQRFPQWQGNLFIASAQRGEVARTGSIERVVVNNDLGDIRREQLLTELHQRVVYVTQGADGLLYVLTSNFDEKAGGALLRIEPVP